MVTMVSVPISYRVLIKVFLCVIIVAITGVVTGSSTTNDYDHEVEVAVKAATGTLQREIDSLQEQLELFEMKHETLQAASEHFRVQSKSAKSKLDEERNRYEILASEKRSLETNIESKVANALQDQKAKFEDTIAAEQTERQKLLAKEIQELGEKLRRSEYQFSMLEDSTREKIEEQSKQYEVLEEKRKVSEGKLRAQITDLTERLSFSEKQAKSFEESWKNSIAESEAKDDYLQKESEKRIKEASRWETRIQKQYAESKKMFKEKQAKEDELIESEKLHKALLKKVQTSDEAIKQHESKVITLTTENKSLSNDLSSKTIGLTQSKKAYATLFDNYEDLRVLNQETELMLKTIRAEEEENASKKSTLQNELVDARFEFETIQKKTKQLIEENSEMTKAYTAALEQLSSKNNVLRNELVDMKFEFEKRQNETQLLMQRIEDETTEKDKIQTELLYAELKVESSKETEEKLTEKNRELLQMYEKIEEAGTKLLDTKQQYKKSQDNLQRSVQKLEGKVEDLTKQLELKVAKNSFLQKTLLYTKDILEESQNKVKDFEGQQVHLKTTTGRQTEFLEIENKKFTERVKVLEQELQKSSYLYSGVSREVSNLRDQLNATESRSVEFSRKYESLKKENDVLSRNFSAAKEELGDVQSSLKMQGDSFGHNPHSDASKKRVGEIENKVLIEEQDILEESESKNTEVDESQVKAPTILEESGSTEQDFGETASQMGSEPLLHDNTTAINECKSQTSAEENVNNVLLNEESESASSDISNKSVGSIQNESEPSSWSRFFLSIFRWLDYALYQVLRVIVDSARSLTSGLWKILSHVDIGRLATPFKSLLTIVSLGLNELRIIHDALVSLFEFEMTFVSSLLSREKDRTGFGFLIHHSEIIVIIGEVITALLCIDFVISSFMNPRRVRKRQPRTIEVPKTTTGSLLRKANNM